MLNIVRNIKRLNLLRAAASIAFVLILMPDTTHSQTPASNYTARGIAPVSGGNISAARATAITDAQQKIVLAALADQISLEKLSSSFATLHNLFISRQDVYVQRFKILSETTLAGTHYILIEAFTENELLRRDLESIGMHGPAQQKTAAFLMVAETSADKKYARWWAIDPTERILPLNVSERMALSLQERGIAVIDKERIPVEFLAPNTDSVFPGHEAILTAASRAGADIAVLARTDLKQTEAQPESAFIQVQCDMTVEVLDVRTRELILQTATNALGIHIDQEAAAQEAVAKACSRLAEQISDRTRTASSSTHTYSFRCTFPGARPESASQDFFSLLRAALPEIIQLKVRPDTEANIRFADIISSVDGASLVQKTMRTQPGGYGLTLGVVEDTVINLTVTQPGKP
jgi:hypothetical protein